MSVNADWWVRHIPPEIVAFYLTILGFLLCIYTGYMILTGGV